MVDQVEQVFLPLLRKALGGTDDLHRIHRLDDGDTPDYDVDLLLRRINGGKNLRIGTTDRRVFPPFGQNKRAYCYADEYRNVEDILAMCLASAYVPFVTGPVLGSRCISSNKTILRAHRRIEAMTQLGYIKDGTTNRPIPTIASTRPDTAQFTESNRSDTTTSTTNDDDNSHQNSREILWDGGLVNIWPVYDDDTLIVTPMNVVCSPNPFVSPAGTKQAGAVDASRFSIPLDENVRLVVSPMDNIRSVRHMILSSDDATLEAKFQEGYDDTKGFLSREGLLKSTI